jgi:Uma2 family endonuclease
MTLGNPFDRGVDGPGGWVILFEPKIQFGPQLLVPDLAAWRKEGFVLPRKGPFEVVPDWVCEVLSPSTSRFDRVTKLPIYAREGVSYIWMIDPEGQTLEVLRRHDDAWLIVATHGQDDKVRAVPFEAVELDLSLIWSEVTPESEGGD